MNSFAIVKLGPSQQKVSVGDVVITDLLKHEVGTKFTVSEVYMTSEDGKYTIGTPTVGTVVEFEVLDHEKGEKVRIHKFKAKSRYHKTTGFRAKLTRLKVLSIGVSSEDTTSTNKTSKVVVEDKKTVDEDKTVSTKETSKTSKKVV